MARSKRQRDLGADSGEPAPRRTRPQAHDATDSTPSSSGPRRSARLQAQQERQQQQEREQQQQRQQQQRQQHLQEVDPPPAAIRPQAGQPHLHCTRLIARSVAADPNATPRGHGQAQPAARDEAAANVPPRVPEQAPPAPNPPRPRIAYPPWWNADVAARTGQVWLPSPADPPTDDDPTIPPIAQDLLYHQSWFGVTNVKGRPEQQDAYPFDATCATKKKLDDAEPMIGTIKMRLYPTKEERLLLNKAFWTHRAVYNKLVESFKIDCRLAERRAGGSWGRLDCFCFNRPDLYARYHPIATKATLTQFLSPHHLTTPSIVINSAYHDFRKAIESSRAQYFERVTAGEQHVSVPELTFKSISDRSNSIQMPREGIEVVGDRTIVRFLPRYFRFATNEGMRMTKPIEDPQFDVRLQRMRNGRVYLCIPHQKVFEQTRSTRVCAIDPGVRAFATIYDPGGLTLGVHDADDRVFKRCLVIDRAISKRARARGKRFKRRRHRLSKHVTNGFQRVRNIVDDMHHKVTTWLSSNYHQVLLPSFRTSEMTAQQRRLSRQTTRKMLTMAHYRFKKLLEHKMACSGGVVLECEEEWTTKTCSRCGRVNHDMTFQRVFWCPSCDLVLDRDVNAARNIFLKNEVLLA